MIPQNNTPNNACKCSKCQSSDVFTYELYSKFIHLCNYCGGTTEIPHQFNGCCPDENLVSVYKLNTAGVKMHRKQCTSCGWIGGGSGLKVTPELPAFNEELFQQWESRQKQMGTNYSDYVYKKQEIFDRNKTQKVGDFWDKYNTYLKSEEWQKKRKLVLLRDRFLCQSCYVTPATDVHHLTYDFVGNEPLFSLISLCRGCHDKIHAMQKLSFDENKRSVGLIEHRIK